MPKIEAITGNAQTVVIKAECAIFFKTTNKNSTSITETQEHKL
jgi:hypothetical protein